MNYLECSAPSQNHVDESLLSRFSFKDINSSTDSITHKFKVLSSPPLSPRNTAWMRASVKRNHDHEAEDSDGELQLTAPACKPAEPLERKFKKPKFRDYNFEYQVPPNFDNVPHHPSKIFPQASSQAPFGFDVHKLVKREAVPAATALEMPIDFAGPPTPTTAASGNPLNAFDHASNNFPMNSAYWGRCNNSAITPMHHQPSPGLECESHNNNTNNSNNSNNSLGSLSHQHGNVVVIGGNNMGQQDVEASRSFNMNSTTEINQTLHNTMFNQGPSSIAELNQLNTLPFPLHQHQQASFLLSPSASEAGSIPAISSAMSAIPYMSTTMFSSSSSETPSALSSASPSPAPQLPTNTFASLPHMPIPADLDLAEPMSSLMDDMSMNDVNMDSMKDFDSTLFLQQQQPHHHHHHHHNPEPTSDNYLHHKPQESGPKPLSFQFRMGFRPNCEKCINKVSGHFSHLD